MTAPKREKAKLKSFSDFMLNTSEQEKTDFFTEVAQKATEEQRQMIAKAERMVSN